MAKRVVRRTIDITPTWSGVMPAIIAAIRDGSAEGQKQAEAELARAARILDQFTIQDKGEGQGEYTVAYLAKQTTFADSPKEARAIVTARLEADDHTGSWVIQGATKND